MVTVQYMWIDDTSADVIKVDFEALYHGDYLVKGDTSGSSPTSLAQSDSEQIEELSTSRARAL